ncbi:MAG TPA: alpha-glucosidase [Puia sp.]|nr:alpha-glucosidase [Puia sp.]
MPTPTNEPKWWKEAIVYQIFPRSFQDSDGDGNGDLPGILSRLDYIISLGVNTLWINPVYRSPGRDNGYDISDFRDVDPVYGSMTDLETLIKKLHESGLRLIMDMVINHTSDEHHWFREARSSHDNPYYPFYIWWPAEKGKPPYRRGFFDPAGEAWKFNETTDSYYLHYFSAEQPDLNWDNRAVRQELYKMLRFWLDRGVDGLRFDALTFISKDQRFPEITPAELKACHRNDWGYYYATGPHLHEYLRELHREVLSHYDCVAIAEASGVSSDTVLDFVAGDRGELNLLYHFEGMLLGTLPGFKKPDPAGWDRGEFKKLYTRWSEVFNHRGWGTIYLGNHDQPRMLSRWGDDSEPYRDAAAKLLFTFLLTMRATPFLYNGDELGMANIRFASIEEYEDIETTQMYEKLRAGGGDMPGFLQDQQLMGRDNSRTPFQWSAGQNAGFTTGRPWLKVNPDHVTVNEEAEEKDTDSVLNFVRRMIRIRKQYPALVYGSFSALTHDGSPVFAYNRILDGVTLSVLLNFSGIDQRFDGLLSPPSAEDVLINNYPVLLWTRQGLRLKPWQTLIFKQIYIA